jgi:hypothetical protein
VRRIWRDSRALALALAVGGLLAGGCGEDEQAETVVTRDPVKTFAPMVVHHADEQGFPTAAGEFIRSSTLEWNGGDSCGLGVIAAGRRAFAKTVGKVAETDPARLGGAPPYSVDPPEGAACRRGAGPVFRTDQLTRPLSRAGRPAGLAESDGFVLDLLTAYHSGTRPVRRSGRPPAVAVPAYYERRAVGEDDLRITYWLLYATSVMPTPKSGSWEETEPLTHEGGWVRIGVLLRREGRSSYAPVSVSMENRSRFREVAWEDARRVATHPVAYSSLGGHALYAEPGSHRYAYAVEGERRVATDFAMGCDSCPEWRTWETGLRDVRKEPWYGYGGAWGSAGTNSAGSGTIGPSRFAPPIG